MAYAGQTRAAARLVLLARHDIEACTVRVVEV